MSFLIDPPWLYANGYAYARAAPPVARRPPAATAAGAATIAIFWGVSIPLYLNQRWTRPLWRLCGARSGRDWMLNSGVLSLEHRRPSRRTHAVSAAIFATYPLWLWLGWRRGRIRA